MSDIFLTLVNISVNATYLIGAILLFRLIFKNVPKWINCILWSMVAIRLFCPFSIESVTSLLPDNDFLPYETVFSQNFFPKGQHLSHYTNYNPVDFSLGFEEGSVVFNEFSSPSHDFINPLYLIVSYLTSLWIAGIIALIIYSIISCVKLHKNVAPSILYKDNIYFCDNIDTPFIWGFIKHKIYIPSQIDENNLEYIIRHEKAHIRRGDFLWKPLAFLVLAVYWFNPAIWLAYIFFCKDMETACDEKVIKNADNEYKANYSKALLSCSTSKKLLSSCPVAFGETGIKSRIKNVLKHKKPTLWIIIVSLILCVVFCLAFLTTPAVTLSKIIEEDGYRITTQKKKETPLTIPVNIFTDDIYSEDGQTFKKNEVIVYEDGNSRIYLEHALFSSKQLFLQFDFSHTEIPSSGSVLTGYKKDKNGYYPNTTGLSNTDIIVDNNTFNASDPACVYTYGPGGSFGISMNEDIFTVAKEKIVIPAFCEELSYIKKATENLPFEETDFFENTCLQPVEYVMKSEGSHKSIVYAPRFYLYDDRKCEKTADNIEFQFLGQFVKTELSKDNFYSAFTEVHWEKGYEDFLKSGFDSAWQITDEKDVYFLLQRDNNFYLCCGKTFPEKGINITFDCIYKTDIFNTETSLVYEDPSNGVKSVLTLNYQDESFVFDTGHYIATGTFSVAIESPKELLYLEECDDDGEPYRVYIFEKSEKGYKFSAQKSTNISDVFSSATGNTPHIPDNAEFLRTSEKLLINEWFEQKYIFPKVYNLGEYERTSYKHYHDKSFIFCTDIYVLKVRYDAKKYQTQKTAVESMYNYVDLTTYNRTYKYIEGVDFTPYSGETFSSDDYTFRLVDSESYGLYGSPKEMFFVGTSDARKELVFVLYYNQDMDNLFGETFDEHLHNTCPELYEYTSYLCQSHIEKSTVTIQHSEEKTIKDYDYDKTYEICEAIDSLKMTSAYSEKVDKLAGTEITLNAETLFGEEKTVTLFSGYIKFDDGEWLKADEKSLKKLEKLLVK